jgi:hypothetical protein
LFKENALNECGYTRNKGTRFEDFIQQLIETEKHLPIDRLEEFLKYFKWILHDPKLFDIDDLKKFNQLLDKMVNL